MLFIQDSNKIRPRRLSTQHAVIYVKVMSYFEIRFWLKQWSRTNIQNSKGGGWKSKKPAVWRILEIFGPMYKRDHLRNIISNRGRWPRARLLFSLLILHLRPRSLQKRPSEEWVSGSVPNVLWAVSDAPQGPATLSHELEKHRENTSVHWECSVLKGRIPAVKIWLQKEASARHGLRPLLLRASLLKLSSRSLERNLEQEWTVWLIAAFLISDLEKRVKAVIFNLGPHQEVCRNTSGGSESWRQESITSLRWNNLTK